MPTIFPELNHMAKAGDVDRLAIYVRKYFAGENFKSPRISVMDILMAMGIEVFSESNNYHGQIAAKDERGRFTVAFFYRPSPQKSYDAFLLAHMLGHYLFEIQPKIAAGDFTKGGMVEVEHPCSRFMALRNAELFERRADHFASALMVPRAMLVRAMEKLGEIEKVAAFFNQSPAFIYACLDSLMPPQSEVAPGNFIAAERMLDQGQSNRSMRQEQTSLERKSNAGNSVATAGNVKINQDVSSQDPAALKGMERIRKLATMLEKKPAIEKR